MTIYRKNLLAFSHKQSISLRNLSQIDLNKIYSRTLYSGSIIRYEKVGDVSVPKGPLGTNVFELNHKNLEIPKIPEPVAKHNILTCTATFIGYMPDHLDLVTYFARYSAHAMGLPCSHPIHLETKWERWNMAKGPFVHGTKQENFERKTFARALQIFDGPKDCIRDWVDYVNARLPAGVNLNVDLFAWESANYANKLQKELKLKESESFKGIDQSLIENRREELNFDEKVRKRAEQILKKLSS